MIKKWIAAVLCVALMIMPLTGMTLFTVSAASDGTFAVQALSFEAGYASTQDGKLDLSAVKKYDAYEQYNLRYLDDNTALSSTSGIPYQVFDVALDGKTSGTVALSYSGSTKKGERIALRAYNARTKAWDTLGSFKGTGSVSAEVNVSTYNDGGVIHVAAVLDYVTNGSNTMIWSTDPQHYTKFEDLHEFYYKVYQFAAEQYVAGNAGYILTTGDLVDDLPTTSIAPYQWAVSDRAMQYVEEVGMPNGLVSGNHDVGTFNSLDFSTPTTANYDRFWETFPASRYENERWYGGSLNNNASHYDLITIGNVDFLVLFLGYGVEATDETIAWANEVLKTYPHRTAIVATHQYLEALDANYKNRGQLIFDSIVSPNANVKMVLCGHDDGSVCREVTAADGRKVYEVLADYQFVEAEDPDFYANEHWIGKVDSCCGDGYIRLMTVEGDTLSSITYSPVTGRYNPYGESEMYSIDLDCGTPDRTMSTSRFSAAIVGSSTSATDVDRITRNAGVYSAITYASVPAAPAKTDATPWPTTMYGQAATPSEPQYQHNAVTAPNVAFKVDVLQACGLGKHPVLNGRTMNFGEYALDLTVDLSKTPYLYYSFAAPEGSKTTFAFVNDTANAPWLTFLDATKGGATMNKGAENWDSYAGNGNQYFTTSMTGCIDMRTLRTTDSNEWIVEQLNVYNANQTNVVMSYLFFGSEPIDALGSAFGDPATPADPASAHASVDAPVVEEKVNVLGSVWLNDNAFIYENINYGDNALSLKVDLNKTPYLYYSFGQKASSRFTFALINNNVNVPWIAFLDASKGGGVMNTGADNWNNAGGTQYFTTSMTGCIDMRQYLKDPSNMTWEVEQVNFYNPDRVKVQMNYLFFGSAAPGGDDQKSVDSEALDALIAKADTASTDGMTDATVKALKIAKNRAKYVDRADAIAVGHAYFALSEALGALTKTYVPYNDINNLTSVAKYSMTMSNWKCNAMGVALTDAKSFITAEQTSSGGLRIKRSSASTHNWPGIAYKGSNNSYSVKPYGGVYMKLDMKATTGWAISIAVTQDGVTTNVRLNEGIVDSFYNKSGDNFYGTFKNVYDVSEAFRSFGVDPTAPFSVSGLTILSVGAVPSWNTYYHLELLTGKSTSASTYYLGETIKQAQGLTKSMYTSASWSTLSSALSKANTAMSTSGLSQPEINLAKHRLENALKGLELVSWKQPAGSVLPSDIGAWVGNNVEVKYNGNATVVTNTDGQWACSTYQFTNDRRIRLDKYQLEVDMTLAGHANILMNINGEWKSISADLTDKLNGEDMKPGTYKMKIPMNEIASFAGEATVVIDGIRVWSVGAIGSNAVTINYIKITPYCEHEFDYTKANFAEGATPASPYMTHAAANGPNVGKKVDVLAASGIDKHDVFTAGSTTFGDQKMRLTVDLAKTPYLYYSIVQPADSKCTLGFYNDSTTAPWFSFLDANWGGAAMNKDIANWDAYSGSNASQYFQGSVTGCIDMRNLLKDASATQWVINQLTVYTAGSHNAQISYLYFGTAPLDNGYEEPPYTPGDVNMDGSVTSVDARMTLLYVLNITDKQYTAQQIAACDFNGDGTRNTTDVRQMLQKALGI
ncbi:MAG: metallophosphoesterase [Clostridia bacterium]|nr:metallophosphoesterase [Clostridia bacterium]